MATVIPGMTIGELMALVDEALAPPGPEADEFTVEQYMQAHSGLSYGAAKNQLTRAVRNRKLKRRLTRGQGLPGGGISYYHLPREGEQ